MTNHAPEQEPSWACFDDFRLDLTSQELHQGTTRLKLPQQAFRVLVLLLENEGQLLNRESICEHIWQDRVVEYEASLNTAIRQIRQALRDDPAQPRYIETVPRRGYRFIGQAHFGKQEVKRSRNSLRWGAVAGIALLLAVVAGWQAKDHLSNSTQSAGSDRLADLRSPGYEHYLRGRNAMRENRLDEAELELRSAIMTDPQLATSYVSLARTLVRKRWEGWQNIVEAQSLVDRALEINPELPEAHVLSAGIALYYWRDRESAAAQARMAQMLAPGDPKSFVVSGYLETIKGKPEQALGWIAKAHELAPLSPTLNADYGWMHYKARHWDDAERLCKASIGMNPNSQFAHECIIHVKHSKGDHAEAAEYGLSLMALRGATEAQIMNIRQIADAQQREQAFWNWTLNWLEQNPMAINDSLSKRGIALTMLGRLDESIAVFDQALTRNGEAFLGFIPVDPRLDELRSHAGFEHISERSRLAVPRDHNANADALVALD